MSDRPDLSTPDARYKFALQNYARATAMYDLVFPPWRWPKWSREHRAVRQAIRWLREAQEQSR